MSSDSTRDLEALDAERSPCDENTEHDGGCMWLPPELWTVILNKLRLQDLLVTQHVSTLFQTISRAAMDSMASDPDAWEHDGPERTCMAGDAFEHSLDYMTDVQVVDVMELLFTCESCEFRLYPGLAYRLARLNAMEQLQLLVDSNVGEHDIPELQSAVNKLLREGRVGRPLGYLLEEYMYLGMRHGQEQDLLAAITPAAGTSVKAMRWFLKTFLANYFWQEVCNDKNSNEWGAFFNATMPMVSDGAARQLLLNIHTSYIARANSSARR